MRFKLDSMFPLPIDQAADRARALEQLGYDGIWSSESPAEPYLPLVPAALATRRAVVGTAVATSFTRSPMVTALTAWELQRASGGRFVLGLGTQSREQNARRYSVRVRSPHAQLRELIPALRHIWGAFQGTHALGFHGEHYRLDLLAARHGPGPIEHPEIPIFVGAVGPRAYALAGELADGVHVHPFHTAEHLRDVLVPALQEGVDRASRSRAEVQLACGLFAVVGDDPATERRIRLHVAAYASSPDQAALVERHGWGRAADRLRTAARRDDADALAAAVDDDMLGTVAIVAPTWAEAAALVRRRYDGLLDRVGFFALDGAIPFEACRGIAAAFAAMPAGE